MAPLLGFIGELSPQEMWTYQHGPADKIRALVKKMDFQMEMLSGIAPTLPEIPNDKLKNVAVPRRVLQRRQCGRPIVHFAGPPIQLPEPIGWHPEYVGSAAVRQAMLTSPCRTRVLQTCMTFARSEGLESAAWLAKIWKFVDSPFTSSELEDAARLLLYPTPYGQAREAYAATVNVYEIPVAHGDWGACLASEVERLRPGIQIPKRLQRDHYLVKMIGPAYEPTCLDWYSMSYNPLFRAPLSLAA